MTQLKPGDRVQIDKGDLGTIEGLFDNEGAAKYALAQVRFDNGPEVVAVYLSRLSLVTKPTRPQGDFLKRVAICRLADAIAFLAQDDFEAGWDVVKNVDRRLVAALREPLGPDDSETF